MMQTRILTKIAFLLPALTLSIVAIRQIVVSQEEHLSPWKGGGFGMYSTADKPNHRSLQVFLFFGTERVPYQPRLEMDSRFRLDLLAHPSKSTLQHLAHRIMARPPTYEQAMALHRRRLRTPIDSRFRELATFGAMERVDENFVAARRFAGVELRISKVRWDVAEDQLILETLTQIMVPKT